MSQLIKITESQEDLIKEGNALFYNDVWYYNWPFWLEATDEKGVFNCYNPQIEALPINLEAAIKKCNLNEFTTLILPIPSIKLVAQFHQVFKHLIADKPSLPPAESHLFRTRFIKEELDEAQVAYLKDGDLVEYADALGDIQYVLDGWFLNAGLHNKKDAILAEIHRSNMTKSCVNEQECIDTIKVLTEKDFNQGFNFKYGYCQSGDRWIVYKDENGKIGKIQKSINYSKPDLKPIIYG